MERNFKRISDGLKLPQESRERIRSQLASYQKQSEDIPMKKIDLKISCAVDCRRCCYDDGINADRCRSGGCASVQK